MGDLVKFTRKTTIIKTISIPYIVIWHEGRDCQLHQSLSKRYLFQQLRRDERKRWRQRVEMFLRSSPSLTTYSVRVSEGNIFSLVLFFHRVGRGGYVRVINLMFHFCCFLRYIGISFVVLLASNWTEYELWITHISLLCGSFTEYVVWGLCHMGMCGV